MSKVYVLQWYTPLEAVQVFTSLENALAWFGRRCQGATGRNTARWSKMADGMYMLEEEVRYNTGATWCDAATILEKEVDPQN